MMSHKSMVPATGQGAGTIYRGGNLNNSARIFSLNLHVKVSRGGFRPSPAMRPVKFQGGEAHYVA